jgi:nudix-type nucleoside diphosphatase (YffH/AdpP family)
MSNDLVRIIRVDPLSEDWNKLEKVTFNYVRANGQIQTLTREIYHVDDGATVLLYNRLQRTVILVRQFRLPAYLRGTHGHLLETPAGLLDGAAPLERMKLEVEEETGYRISTMEKVFDAIMVPGCVTHVVHFFIAPYLAEDRVGLGGGIAGEGEEIEVVEMTIEEAVRSIENGQIVDGKTIMLLHYAAWRLFAD